MTIQLLQGDCRTILPTLPEKSVQVCVTSPPYFGLRRYDVEGNQIGAEQTPAEYVAALVEAFLELRRILRDDGTLWLNLGDSYSGSWGNYAPGGIKNQQRPQTEEGKRWERRAYGDTTTLPATARVPGLAEKNLIGIPWRVAFALQDSGWILRADCIWSKPNCMPESVTDRPTRSHEYLFLFAKSPRYYYDADAIREPHGTPRKSGPNALRGQVEIRPRGNGQSIDEQSYHPLGRNKRSVWAVATMPYAGAHIATFPEQLIEPCVLAGSSPRACEVCGAPWERVTEKTPALAEDGKTCLKCGKNHGKPKIQTEYTEHRAGKMGVERYVCNDYQTSGWRPTCRHKNEGTARCTVLDPFVGSGTTCRVAERFGRNSIGIDLGYLDLQERRTDGIQVEMDAFL